MTEWEYRTTGHYTNEVENPASIESSMDRMGEDGWELVSVTEGSHFKKKRYVFFYKRPKTD